MTAIKTEFLARWHQLVENKDLVALEKILAEDVTMGAPPYWDKLQGRSDGGQCLISGGNRHSAVGDDVWHCCVFS
jgi:hypothetical protein